MSPEETHTILKKVQDSDFKGLTELNLSCPNVPGNLRLPMILIRQIGSCLRSLPISPNLLASSCHLILISFILIRQQPIFNKYPLKFVNCVNSIGNGLYIEDESVVIRPKNGFGGIGGEYIKPTALANVHAFYQRLNPEIQIVGTGGVLTGRDAFEHILLWGLVWCKSERHSIKKE